MVWEANPNQLQLPAHTFGVTVDEFGGQAFHRSEESGPQPGQLRYPVLTHDSIIVTDWLAYQ
jgi:hypothetical protein